MDAFKLLTDVFCSALFFALGFVLLWWVAMPPLFIAWMRSDREAWQRWGTWSALLLAGAGAMYFGVRYFLQLPSWLSGDLLLVGGLGGITFLLVRAASSERWERALRRFRTDRLGLAALLVVCLYIFVGALETFRLPTGEFGAEKSLLDLIVQKIPNERSYSAPLAHKLLNDTSAEPAPLNSNFHLLGTEQLGKDVFVETLKGCRTALILGGLTSAIYIPLGALMGLLGGYFRRRVDDLVQYFYSVLASVPEILLLVSIMFVQGQNRNLLGMSIALGVTGWVGLCRLVRGETMRQSERTYVTAARSIGQSHWQIMMRHLLPNVMHLVLINFVLGFSSIVLTEAVLSYLGVGCPVGTASWGLMIDSGRSELSRDPVVWWNLTAAAVALFGLVLALNLLGDSLRRAFDPKRS